jgi:light-regulated signal transduction histidine kinase (bacteriophytochrome)
LNQREELARSNKDLEQFAYVASHDLQEPLRAVAGCVQLLQKRYEGQIDARADEFIEHTADGCKRMQSLIDDLLTFSRIGPLEHGHGPVSCSAALAAALRNLSAAIEETGAEISSDTLPEIRGEKSQLAMLFQNLVGNAIKFRQNGEVPRVHISATLSGRQATFSVTDNGIGISPEHSERIFGLFQRLHTRREYAGTGIGLALCKRIIERHGGRIWVESVLGKGATFCFTLPLANGDAS